MGDDTKSSFRKEFSMTRNQLICVVGIVLAFLGLIAFLNMQDPLQGKTPEVQAILTDHKTRCENRVQSLHAAKIKGADEYEDAQRANHKCIAFLIGVVNDGRGDQKEIASRLADADAAANEFCKWADEKLNEKAFGKGVEDYAKIAMDLLNLLDGQEQARRRRVVESLEKCRFRSWHDIAKGN